MGDAGLWISFEYSVKKAELVHFPLLGESKMTSVFEALSSGFLSVTI